MHYTELLKAREVLTGPGGEFEIVEADILGNRLRVYKNAPPSVREVWLSTLQFLERDYLVYKDERWTYADAHRDVAAAASWLSAQGLKPGDRVAIAMRNYPEWMLLYWACVSTGLVVVGMNAWWTSEEMEYALKDSEPKVLFADAERLERALAVDGVADRMKIVAVRAPDAPAPVIQWVDVLAHGGDLPDVAVDPDADACIFYTSGTTGFPKGAQLTHRGCVSNLLNMVFSSTSTALATQMATGEAPPEEAPIPVALITTPLFHVTANNCGAYLITAAEQATHP